METQIARYRFFSASFRSNRHFNEIYINIFSPMEQVIVVIVFCLALFAIMYCGWMACSINPADPALLICAPINDRDEILPSSSSRRRIDAIVKTTVETTAAFICCCCCTNSSKVPTSGLPDLASSSSSSHSGGTTPGHVHCYLCEKSVDSSAKHCRYCDKCVKGFDHHWFVG